MKKRLTTLIVSVLLMVSASLSAQVSTWDGSWEPWTNGTGIEDDPFLIENARQLAYLAYRVNNGLDANGTHISNHDYHYKLMVDVNLNGSENFQWTPIGYWNSDTDYQCFGGYFDGNDYTVSNLYINSSANRIGFFGFTDGSTIKNLNIISTMLASIGEFNYGNHCNICGGIVGVVNDGTLIDNCIHTGEVVSSCINSGNGSSCISTSVTGGVVGIAYGSILIKNCIHSGCVYSTADAYGAYSNCGGIIGRAESIADIVNCYNVSSVVSSCLFTAYSSSYVPCQYSYSGGILGYSNNMINVKNCYNKGSITASYSGYGYYHDSGSGGIVGWSEKTNILDSYNLGNINSTVVGRSGGIVGVANTTNVNPTSINNCYNIGIITGGSIVGYSPNMPTVNNCYYLNTSGGSNNYGGAPMEASVMQSNEFVTILNNGTCSWEYDSNNTNSGYPILTMVLILTTTSNATDVTQSHTTLHGRIEVENTSIVSQGFEYKRISDYDYQTIIMRPEV